LPPAYASRPAPAAGGNGGATGSASWEVPVQFKFTGRRTPPREVNTFLRQLSTMLSSGIPLSRGLEVLTERTRDQKLRGAIARVLDDVERGSQFWSALARHPELFNPMTVNIIRTGEESGSLVKVMDYLATYRDREEDMARMVQRAVTYPMIILIIALGVMLLVLTTIIPQFAVQYSRAQVELPWPTRLIINFSEAATNVGLVFFVLVAFGIWIYRRSDQVGGIKNFVDRMKLKLPVFGRVLTNIYTVQFSAMLAILLKAGLPMPRALDLVRDTMPNVLFKDAFAFVKDSIEKGRTLNESFQPIDVVPPLVKDMVAVGEEAGTLPLVLDQITAIYQKDVDHETAMMGELIEPFLILGLGVIAGFIAISIFWPYVKMVQVVGAPTP
ncbi:type II secretion system F family protein, partial [bacterium]|nr:type II secretion system F family protein [bacterium]